MVNLKRRDSKVVKVGNIQIGGNSDISIQSMLNIRADDIENNILQAVELERNGCDIIRVAVPKIDNVNLIYRLKENLNIPVVADIHFDYKIAIECANAGVDKIRINPGNIGDESRVKAVVSECKKNNIPIRIGVNSGSLEKNILNKYGSPTAEALRDSALFHASLLEKFDFDDIVLSLKSSDVETMVKAYELVADCCNYPLHLGVTEAGTERLGIIKSSVGIGSLLIRGIGDTIRVSLTDSPIKEVNAAKDLLRVLGIRKDGIQFISCPTCGRTNIDLIKLANEVQDRLKDFNEPLTVAIMGCIVNGPGEAKEADIGIAGGNGEGLIFKKGKIIKKVPEDKLVDELVKEVYEIRGVIS